MDIVIVGGGQVGRYVAESLSEEQQISVIDLDPERIETIQYELDVLTLEGDGTNVETLREAGVEDCELVVACTDDDKTNIVVCGMARILTDAFTIARINNTSIFRSWRQGKRALGVDFMVASNFLTARTISQIVGLPAARDVDSFVGGHVHMAEFDLPENSALENRSIQDINEMRDIEDLNVMAVFRESDEGIEFKFPRGTTVIQPGDRILMAGKMSAIHRFARFITPHHHRLENNQVVIFGGGEIGLQLARFLEGSGFEVKLIEKDEQRARTVAEQLNDTLVLNENAEKQDFLLEEHVNEADTVVGALGEDEKNLLVSLLSKQIGAQRAVSVVNNKDYRDLFEQVGIDVAVNPRLITAEEMTRYTHGGSTENVALLESEHAEVLEVEVDQDSFLANRLIQDLVDELPREVVFGAIVRENEFVLPRGETKIKPKDHVLILVSSSEASELRDKL